MNYPLIHNESENQYEFDIKDEKALLKYIQQGNALALVHTEVPPDLENQGIAHQLVEKSLDDIRSKGEKIIPICPFVVSFLERNPQYNDLILK